jgi:hypothetical protein
MDDWTDGWNDASRRPLLYVIGPGGSLLVVPHLFAGPVSSFMGGVEKK